MNHGIDEIFIRKRITDLREQKGVTEHKMSLDLGKNKGYIRQIRAGESKLPVTELLAICEYLGVSPRDFFDKSADNPVLMTQATDKIRKLDDIGLKAVIGVANALDKENEVENEKETEKV